ncbi:MULTISPECIES: energy-coupling factor ABC transporter ATP-binding protein [Bacillaceae]|uniref:Energy-coupling factor transporter ATPase n=1 Tax=Domibacillus aminovorans TaxID=29332 RepID=A0A177L1T3_9BACI|nr:MULTISPECIES: energy-coupling factor ABC transporter ATP-binding protein [Bacillaceae]OAH59354.1 energy-coupling factor transporter ATPase [Domibacillus aminovorans]
MNTIVISIKGVSYQYPEQESFALNNVSLDVYKGEWLAIVGHNGSGKSTLAKMLNGLHYPSKGTVMIGGYALNEENVWSIREKLGMVFQNPDNQFVGTTVQDDVAFGLENNGVEHGVMQERVFASLEKVGMTAFLNQEPHHLSGGQKQRVAIAGVIALRPDIILLDEATSMLDPLGREEVMNTVRELNEKEGLTVISITHDLEEAAKADRVIVLNEGRLYTEGTPQSIFQLDRELLNLGLGVPFAVQMSQLLADAGLQLSQRHFNEEELVSELWTLNFKM